MKKSNSATEDEKPIGHLREESQEVVENQNHIASQEIKENHPQLASQKQTENRQQVASQQEKENHPQSASQYKQENQKNLASQNIIHELGRLSSSAYYDHQQVRIQGVNRVRDIIRKRVEGIKFDEVEQKKPEEEKYKALFKDSEIPALLERLKNEDKITQREYAYITKMMEVHKNAEKYEKEYQKLMMEFVENEEIYQKFLKHIKGISAVLSASLIKEFGYCEKAQHISSLWKYTGMHVVEGEAPKRKKGVKLDFNLRLRTLIWKIGDSFIKQRTPFYRDIYDREKAKQLKIMEDNEPRIDRNPNADSEPIERRNPLDGSESKESRNPQIDSEPYSSRDPKMNSEPMSHRKPGTDSESIHIREPQLNSEPKNNREPRVDSEPNGHRKPKLGSEPMHERKPSSPSVPKNKMHCHLRAQRKMTKIFLAHYFMCCKEITESVKLREPSLNSEPNTMRKPLKNSEQPYVSTKLGHKHISNWREAVK